VSLLDWSSSMCSLKPEVTQISQMTSAATLDTTKWNQFISHMLEDLINNFCKRHRILSDLIDLLGAAIMTLPSYFWFFNPWSLSSKFSW
jgi:hypothetical protein